MRPRSAHHALVRPSSLAVILALIALAPGARAAGAQEAQLVGRPITDVRLTLEGQLNNEVELHNALETRVGDPLDPLRVRESIIHLMALSRFDNVLVSAQADGRGGVGLVYDLVPLRTVRAVIFGGRLGLSRDVVASEVSERYGTSPPLGRAADIAATIEELYRDHGYQSVRVTYRPTIERPSGRTTLRFDIEAGPQARIGAIEIGGDKQVPNAELLRRLQLKRDAPYDPSEVTRRAGALASSLRAKGFYQAAVDVLPRFPDDGTAVTLEVNAVRGPRVVVEFKGDPFPRDQTNTLVPIKRENAVDQDLLEDWANNIDRYLQGQGYRDAKAQFSRSRRDDELLITFEVRRGPRYVVDAVDVTNNRFEGISRPELLTLLGVRPGEPFVERSLEAGVARVTGRYQADGFTSAKAQPLVTERRRTAAEVREAIAIEITEGPRTLIASVRYFVDGTQTPAGGLPTQALSTRPGRPFYLPDLDVDRDALLTAYLNRGYQMAAVTLPDAPRMLSTDRTRADVRYDIRTGPQMFVDQVLIVGNNRTKSSTIRETLGVKPGDQLALDKLTEGQQRLAELGLFRRVRITQLQQGSETRRDLLVMVEESPATTIAYGGGVEGSKRLVRDAAGNAVSAIQIAPRGLFEIGRRNLWGKNRSVTFNGSLAARPNSTGLVGAGVWEYLALGTYREPRIFDSGTDLLVSGGVEQTIRTSYSYNRRAVRAELAHRLSPTLSLYGRYSLERTYVFNEQVSPQDRLLIDKLFPQVRVSKVSASLVRDTRDDSIDPARGILASVEGDLAPRAIGSEVGFAKTLGQLFVYRKLPTARRLVFAGGVRLGFASGFARIIEGQVAHEVPISERFFSGNTVRGFYQDSLGTPETLTPEGFPNGGNGLLVVNAELRAQVWKDLAAAAFVDAGNVYAFAKDVDPTNIRPGVGFGLRYKSPIGPIRIDVGFNPSRHTYATGGREPLTVWYFGIGQAF